MNKELVGKKLISLRGDRSREEVCSDLGISVSALAMYEQGNRMPKDEIKVKIANYYNTSIETLFFEVLPHNMCEKTV